MTRLGRVLLVTCAALALAAGVAYADATIYAGPPSQFVGGDVSIGQGEKVTFTNGDTLVHDVTSTGKGADGKALFASAQIGTGQSAPVDGTEYLATGAYEYICSLHTYMTGTITVSSEGTPKPRPGGGGPDKTPPPASASGDTTAPSGSVKVLDTKKGSVRKRRSLQLSFTVDEAVTAAFKAVSGKVVVASGKATLTKAGTKKISVKLTKAGLKLAKSKKPVPISVTATAADAAGNKSEAKASGRLG